MKTNTIEAEDLSNTIHELHSCFHDIEVDAKKNTCTAYLNQTKYLSLRLPLPFGPFDEHESLKQFDYYDFNTLPNYIILLIEAGNAAIASVIDGEIEDHRVIRKYMVRKKQGKSQLNHLNLKGKSRYGSRLRLQESVSFFEEINDYLGALTSKNDIYRLCYGCSTTLWPHLFQEKYAPPLAMRDERWIKIPKSYASSNYNAILELQPFIESGVLIYH